MILDNKIKKFTYKVLITFIFIAHTYLFLYYINYYIIIVIVFFILAEERPGDLERFYESTKGSFCLYFFFLLNTATYKYMIKNIKKNKKN